MAEPPRRPPPGSQQQQPSQRVTAERTAQPAPRNTTPMGTSRAKEIAEKILSDDQTRLDPHETSRRAKFVPEDMLKTTLTPAAKAAQALAQAHAQAQANARRRTTTPMGTAQSEPAESPNVILASQQVLTNEVPPGMLDKLAAEGSVEVRVRGEQPRTQVWVATHRPPEDPDPRLILVREPDSARAASFRVLRHRLQERGDPRVIAVTSAAPREGKTTCAVNLALALGECGRARVLLVEGNLRAPALAPLFGFMPPECFSDQMKRHKQKPLDAWSVVEVFSPFLHVLAVRPSDTGHQLLDGPAFSIALEMLSQAGYDYIVIDTPPVIGAADVNLIEDAADGVLFTAWSRSTSSRALRQAIEQLAPAKLLGVTLLDV